MLKNSKLVGFVATSKPEESKRFYRDCLGLTLIDDTPYALAFAAGDTVVRVQKTERAHPPPYTTLGWAVENISKTVNALTEAGVHFERFAQLEQDDLGVWSASATAKVAWFKDPDGNLLSVTESS